MNESHERYVSNVWYVKILYGNIFNIKLYINKYLLYIYHHDNIDCEYWKSLQ